VYKRQLILRPEYLRPLRPRSKAEVVIEADVYNDYVLGSRTQFHARHGSMRLIGETVAAPGATPKPGLTVRLGFDLAEAVFVPE